MNLDRLLDIFFRTDELYKIINEDISSEEMTDKLCNICLPKDIRYGYMFICYHLNDSKAFNDLLNYHNIDLNKFKLVVSKYRTLYKKGYLSKYNDTYLCDEYELKYKLESLKEMFIIINSDLNDKDKALALRNIYKNTKRLRKEYSLIIKRGYTEPIFDNYKEYLDNFDKILEIYISYEKRDLFNIDNNYYRYILKDYISSNKTKDEYLNDKNIDEKQFNSNIKKIIKHNKILRKDYRLRLLEDKEQTYDNTKCKMDELLYAIKNNKFIDETPLTTFEFIKKSPFKFDEKYYNNLSTFITANYNSADAKIFKQYLIANKFSDKNFYRKVTIDNLLKIKTILNDRELTKDDYNIMLNYLNELNIPCTTKTINEVKKLYIKGLI